MDNLGNITLEQVNWAMEHDWYYYTGTIASTGEYVIHTTDGNSFTDFESLYIWAGY